MRIVDSLIRDNHHGLLLRGGNSADTLTSAAIGESTVAGGSLGIKAESSVASARVRVDVTESSISHNTVGVAVVGSVGSTVLTLNGSMVTANGSGLQQSGSATLKTLGNNSVSGNGGADVSGTLTPFSPIPNNPPGIALTSPLPNQSFMAPASIVLTANASDADGNLARVEFYNGTSLLGSISAAPYSHTWSDVPPGSYTLTARAIDSLGAQAVSAPLGITVSNPPTGVYYLHADHLNTPRMVTDAANQVVWRHLPTTEPFGSSAPEEDPDNDGNPFTLNLRFPGQYFDRETNLHYNYFRDYDPGTGRYVQSDPIGLRGGINTYTYVEGNPISRIDPKGMAAITIPVPDIPLPDWIRIPGARVLGGLGLILSLGGDTRQTAWDCFDKCARARDAAALSCAQMWGNDGINPNDDQFGRCVALVMATWRDCVRKCERNTCE